MALGIFGRGFGTFGSTAAPPMTPDVEDSLLRRISHGTLSGLAMAGNLLDIPGSMVRDTIRGRNPFDQLLTPFSPDNRTSGRDLLTHFGLARPNIEGFHPFKHPGDALADVGGFLGEVAADPLTYLGPGLLTRGLQAGTRAGAAASKTPGFLRASIPFTSVGTELGTGPLARRVAGRLDTAYSALGKSAPVRHFNALFSATTMGVAGVEGQPLARELTAANEATRSGVRQQYIEHASNLARSGAADEEYISPLRQMMEGVPTSRMPKTATPDAIGAMQQATDWQRTLGAKNLEEAHRTGAPFGEFSDLSDAAHAARYLWGHEGPLGTGGAGTFNARGKSSFRRADALRDIAGATEQLRRIVSNFTLRRRLGKLTPEEFAALSPADVKRFGYAADGTKNATPHDLKLATDYVAKKYGHRFIEKMKTVTDFQGNTMEVSTIPQRIAGVVDTVNKLTPEQAKIGMFGNHPLNDTMMNLINTGERINAAQKVAEGVARHATLATPYVSQQTERLRRLASSLPTGTDIKAEAAAQLAASRRADNQLLARQRAPAGFAKVRDVIGKNRAINVSMGDSTGGLLHNVATIMDPAGLINKKGKLKGQARYRIANALIPESLANALQTINRGWQAPQSTGPINKLLDSGLNLFKAGVLTAPGRYVRDVTSGTAQNVLTGQVSPLDYIKSLWGGPGAVTDAQKLLRGESLTADAAAHYAAHPDVAESLARQGLPPTPANVTQAINHLLYAHETATRSQGVHGFSNLTGAADTNLAREGSLQSQLGELPGANPGSLLGQVAASSRKAITGHGITDEAGKPLGFWKTTPLNPKNWPNVRGVQNRAGEVRTTSTLAPVAGGEEIGRLSDQFNRLPAFLANLRKGKSAAESAKTVGETQVNYNSRTFSKTEQQVMKRLFPFYSFTSRMGPAVAKELWRKPGGGIAQSIRAANYARSDSPQPVPDYVSESLAIPLGTNPDGSKRYLSGLGLMHEDPLSYLSPSLKSTGLEVLSKARPGIKAPLEYLTGQSFFQKGPEGGRSMKDLDPTVGRIIANLTGEDQAHPVLGSPLAEQVLSNSPLARLLTTARTLTDKRKRNSFAPNIPVPGAAGLANVLTGARINDVSPASQDAMIRDAAQEVMHASGAKTFEKVYFPEDVLARMTPQQRQDAELWQALQSLLAKRTKERKVERMKKLSIIP